MSSSSNAAQTLPPIGKASRDSHRTELRFPECLPGFALRCRYSARYIPADAFTFAPIRNARSWTGRPRRSHPLLKASSKRAQQRAHSAPPSDIKSVIYPAQRVSAEHNRRLTSNVQSAVRGSVDTFQKRACLGSEPVTPSSISAPFDTPPPWPQCLTGNRILGVRNDLYNSQPNQPLLKRSLQPRAHLDRAQPSILYHLLRPFKTRLLIPLNN